jgi:phosphatidylglycerophosphate synthase
VRRESRAREAACSATIFVTRPSVAERTGAPGGLALLDRQLKQLRKLAVDEVTLLVREHEPIPVVAASLFVPRVVRVPDATRDLWAALAATAADLAPAGLALGADHLVDLRVLRTLLSCAETTVVSADGERTEQIAWVRASDVRRHGAEVPTRAARLPLASLDPYSPELRGTATPYAFAVVTPADHGRAWWVLLDAVQKRALDLPGQYFDTPFENFLVRRFAPTDVTPNQITLATLVLAAIVATLFAHGWLRVGVLLALVVGVLDGVDGKLARMKLATSKIGELEHVGDFLYENAWYLSLAAWFAFATGSVPFWYAGVVLVACDLTDSLLYLVAQKRTGRMLDELTSFDRRFRAVAGRRNVYVMIFVAGFLAGDPPTAFLLAVAWATTTVAVHALRVAAIVRAPRAN